MTAACDPAPLEIGNRVWFDQNKNGLQDPNELGVDDLILTLHDMEAAGAEVGRDTTTNGGQYYFNDSNVAGGLLKRNHKYEVRMSTNQTVKYSFLENLEAGGGGGNAIPTAFILKDSLALTTKDMTLTIMPCATLMPAITATHQWSSLPKIGAK
ncbi:MAG: SdrD B-like domain-containing protein [Spirosomataceae bacterium]